jgi:hypothetical protein
MSKCVGWAKGAERRAHDTHSANHSIELKKHRLATVAQPRPIFFEGFAVLLLIALKASQSEVVQVVRTAARIRRLMVNVIGAIERRLAIEAEKPSIPLNEL